MEKLENIFFKIIYTLTSILLIPVILIIAITMVANHIIRENLYFWENFY